MIPVKCRTANDCGVACLATIASLDWSIALRVLHPTISIDSYASRYLGTTKGRMAGGLSALGFRISPEHGAPNLEGKSGLMFVRRGREFGEETERHWLAWERTDGGAVNVWDPAGDGELFEYKPGALHNRGMRLTFWVSVSPIKRRKHT